MSSPVELSNLPVAPSADNADLTLLRKGLTDYQCSVSLIRNINVAALSPLPGGSPAPTDLFLISRTISSTPQNFNIPFSDVSFLKGTRAWFYLQAAPNGWTIVPNTGDRLVACQDQQTTYAGNIDAGNPAGTWQQEGVGGGVPGGGLSINQIPAHNHFMPMDNDSGSSSQLIAAGKTFHTAFRNTPTFTTGGNGSNNSSSNPAGPDYSLPPANPHNHGNTWRPLANVGIICQKNN